MMSYDPKNVLLDEFEQELEDNAELFVPIEGKKRKQIERILKSAKKNKSISLRISENELYRLKERAKKEGMPYQTLITSVLHKYLNGDYLEESEVEKIVKALK